MITTAVLARLDPPGPALLTRPLPSSVVADLADSKALVSHTDVRLGEAWARALAEREASSALASPSEVFSRISLEGEPALKQSCPRHVGVQCWRTVGESFAADESMLERLREHLKWFAAGGVHLTAVRVSVACTRRLNEEREAGRSRLTVDLHAMERLVLALATLAGSEVHAVCGKVGGIADYERFFGPLSGHLHTEITREPHHSAYRFPGVGELHFLMDADAQDPLVMLASLVGKYVRELLMARIARFYAGAEDADAAPPSGYHDPRTARFFMATTELRRKRRIPLTCFERTGSAVLNEDAQRKVTSPR